MENEETGLVMRSPVNPGGGALAQATQTREMAEVQASVIMAKRFPRDEKASLERIINACQRPTLAAGSTYQYSRGGTDITGPSIRLAEAISQQWGNIDCGIRELTQSDGVSEVEAFAWDKETNTRMVKTFQVKHERHTRNGVKMLTDPRDVYEMVANQGARRLRSCILGIIPGDVTEAAVRECEKTLMAKFEVTEERLKSMLDKFAEHAVSKEQIEKRIQRNLDTMTSAQMLKLGNILNSMNDGMSGPADWFDVVPTTETTTAGGKGPSQKQIAIAEAKELGCYTEDMEGQRTRDIKKVNDAKKKEPREKTGPESKGEQHNRIAQAATKKVNDEKKAAGEPAADAPPSEPPPDADAPNNPEVGLMISKECEANITKLAKKLPAGPIGRARAELDIPEDMEIENLPMAQAVVLEELLADAVKEAGL